jgi:ElaB/YqjD/DUF883 family membrane-anchored ribosome-binding protein
MTPPGATEQQSTTEQAKEQVQQVAGQAKEQARNVADQARTQVDERSTQYGQKVTEHASSVRSVADHLRSQGKESEAKYAEQAAEKIEKAGSWLTDSDADKILREVEDFGRQRPWAVIGAGIAIGVAASRMLKASSTQRYETSRPSSTPPANTGTGGSLITPTPRGLPHQTGAVTGLQGETSPTPPRTDTGTWGGNGAA